MHTTRLALGLVAVTSVATSLINPIVASAQSADGSSDSSQSSNDSSQSSAAQSSDQSSTSSLSSGTPPFFDKELSSVGNINTDKLTEECAAAVKEAQKEHKDAIKNGEAQSSFIGPQELAFGLANGYGSYGMPAKPGCVDAEKKAAEDAQWAKVPQGLQSMRGNETTDLIFEVLSIILALGSGLTTIAQLYVTFVPGARDEARTFLRNAGFRF